MMGLACRRLLGVVADLKKGGRVRILAIYVTEAYL